jgi:hypothetical protein
MRIIIVVLLMVSRDYHPSAQPSMRTVSEGKTLGRELSSLI